MTRRVVILVGMLVVTVAVGGFLAVGRAHAQHIQSEATISKALGELKGATDGCLIFEDAQRKIYVVQIARPGRDERTADGRVLYVFSRR
jgi:hypothetical protein